MPTSVWKMMKEITLDEIAIKHGTDKSSKHHYYTKIYEKYFENLRKQPMNILELGVSRGASLRMWKEYFPFSNIYGLDISEKALESEEERISIFIGKQQDAHFLKNVIGQNVKDGFDIIIDDASHHNKYTISSFDTLFEQLNPGGIYLIEDLHCSYEIDKQFRNKRRRMTDFFIKLINSVDINGRLQPAGNRQNWETIPDSIKQGMDRFERYIESIHFYRSMCFIFKR